MARNMDYNKQEAPSASLLGSDFWGRQIRAKSAYFSGEERKWGHGWLRPPRGAKISETYFAISGPMEACIDELYN